MLGKLTTHGPIEYSAFAGMILIALSVAGFITYKKKWRWLWSEWLTSVDHKKIAIMYIILALVMLLRGFIDALMMRAQQAISVGDVQGFLPTEHYDQIFSAHGVIMIFFVAMPFMFGLINLVIPLQIGARDVAFPFLNSVSLWLSIMSAMLVNISLIVGEFAATGWTAYPPLSELAYSPGVGVDYYIWALQLSGIGTLLSAINFFTTIVKMRCPGMSMMRLPIFVWTTLSSMILVLITFPILTVALALLFADRYFGMHVFTADFGGNPMMYINLFWAWGHPEVYILILPAFGVYSEVVATFAKKRLFGYTSMVYATVAITVLSFLVWLHHFFTMGAGANVNAFFGIMTMIIAIPTGVKIFNWLFTMFRGRIDFSVPMYWLVGFLLTFTMGGMTGVLMAIPGADFQLHNSLFLIAHFHNTIIGGVIFGYFAGFAYWFSKATGFKLSEQLGQWSFWCWIIGFFTAFMPIYLVGLMGMTRRLNHTDVASGWQPFLIIAAIGAIIILVGVIFQVLQIILAIKNRKKNLDTTGDPWNGRTLEWSTSSPPPIYNFAITPNVHGRDAYWNMKYNAHLHQNDPHYEDIHMPKNTGLGIIFATLLFFMGFGFIWHITWLIILGLTGAIGVVISRSFDEHTAYVITKEDIAQTEAKYHSHK